MEALVHGSVVAGRYLLGDELGRGSSGVVYRATIVDDSSQVVALKVMSPSYAVDGDSRARFLREARVAAAFDHPRAVDVLDYGDDGGWLYLAMSILEGEPLRARLSCALPTVAEIVEVGAQVAEVLAAAHEFDLVHRDLKPENIFVLAEGADDGEVTSVRVLDFGLAFLAAHDGSLGRLTQEGILGGTPAYMSPEQAQADRLTAATDIYSLGCVLYEMAAGEVPFVGNVPETLARHVYVAPVPLSARELERLLPEALAELIGEMLSKPATKRPAPRQVAERLRAL